MRRLSRPSRVEQSLPGITWRLVEISQKISVDPDLCAGCRYCELICSFRDTQRFNPRAARIRVRRIDEEGVDTPNLCRQCDVCPCVDACPTGAFGRTSGCFMRIDAEACTECYVCVDVCIHNAVFRPPKKGVPLVCDTCGGMPLCVGKCPTHALTIV